MTVTIELIKQKILDSAMRGELVEQNSNDEPVEALLERIEAEKEKLIKEKKIKKKKPLSPINDNEIPYEIPVEWKWVRYVDIVELLNGRAYKKHELLDEEKGITPVLRVGNFFTNQHWYYSDLELEENKYADNGDLLYAWSASFGPKIWDGGKVIFHYHIWKVNLYGGINKDFLYYLLLKDVHDIKDITTGSTMVHVTKANMEKRILPLPPLKEQNRIAEKIASLFSLCNNWEREIIKQQKYISVLRDKVLDDAMRGLLVDQDPNDESADALFEKIEIEKQILIDQNKAKKHRALSPINQQEIPYELPDNWKWVRLGQLISVSSGKGLTSKDMQKEGHIPVYGGNGITGYHNKYNCDRATLVIGRVGFYCGSVHILPEKSWVTDNALIVSYPEKYIDKKWLFYMLNSIDLRRNMSSTAQPVISGAKIYPILTPLPPINVQVKIVEKLDKVSVFIDKLEKQMLLLN